MDGELELLLYAVAFGSGYSLYSVVRRKLARGLRFHCAVLALLLAASCASLAMPDVAAIAAVPSVVGFAALALGPSLLILAGRRGASARRFALASAALSAGSTLIGRPAGLVAEARLYGALGASERGDEEDARRRLRELVATGGLTAAHGGATLAEVLPLAGARRWQAALAALDAAPSSATAVLGIEVRAAAETGDVRRALRALARIEARGATGVALAAAQRGLLAACGRADFLEEARRRRATVLRGPRGTADLAIGRGFEARGDVTAARRAYEAAARVARGALLRDARDGLERIERGAPRRTDLDEEELDGLLALEARCRAAESLGADLRRPAVATAVASVVTTLVSVAVFVFVGDDPLSFLAAGALSEPLVRADGEWWRLFSAMLLHGGWLHLTLNLSCIVVVGVLLERRVGAARTLVIYLGSGFAGSLASVYLNGTQIGVGASGGAMGLIGALLVLLMRRPALFAVMERRRWLSTLWAGTVATAAIGALEYETIDNAAHAAGAAGGALLALALLPPAAGAQQEARWRRAAARAAAASMVGLALAAGYEAARGLAQWESEQEVWADGAHAAVPGWLRATHRDDGTVLLERPPAEVAVLVGSSRGGVADPRALFDESSGLRALFDDARVPARISDEWIVRPAADSDLDALAPEWRGGVRVVAITSGDAFALVRVPVGEDAKQMYAPVVDALRNTLAATDTGLGNDSGR